MRSLFTFLFLSLLAVPAVAADNMVTGPAPSAKELPATPAAAPKAGDPLESAHAKRLDKLFSELKRERNEHAANRISGQIWQQWLDSGSATVDLLMQWANDAIQA
jgi:hypothetical protein